MSDGHRPGHLRRPAASPAASSQRSRPSFPPGWTGGTGAKRVIGALALPENAGGPKKDLGILDRGSPVTREGSASDHKCFTLDRAPQQQRIKNEPASQSSHPGFAGKRQGGPLGLVRLLSEHPLSEGISSYRNRLRRPQGSSAFFCEIKRRARSASRSSVERLFECVVKPERKRFLARFVAGQGERIVAKISGALAKILRDLTGFDPAPAPCR